MCSSFYLNDSQDLQTFISLANSSTLTAKMVSKLGIPLKTSGEVFPGDMVPVVASKKESGISAFPMLWGYGARSATPIPTVSVETASNPGLWHDGWQKHRCVIPASWVYIMSFPSPSAAGADSSSFSGPYGSSSSSFSGPYDTNSRPGTGVAARNSGAAAKNGWQGVKFLLQPKGQTITYLAGVYHIEEEAGLQFPTFSILTTEASEDVRSVCEDVRSVCEDVRSVSNRMPLVMPTDAIRWWVNAEVDVEKPLARAVKGFVVERK